jgi:hypothetical protein
MSDATIGLIGVAVGAVVTMLVFAITVLKEFFIERRNSRLQAEQLGIRLICLLDRFVYNCADVARDDGYHVSSTCAIASPQVKLPKFEFPNDHEGWKSIPASLLYRISSLPLEIDKAELEIQNSFDFSAPPEYELAFEDRQYLFCLLGQEAMDISAKLRDQFGIPFQTIIESDSSVYLTKKRMQIESARAERSKKLNLT